MTKEEFIAKVRAIDPGDQEIAHCMVDDLVLDYFRANDCNEMVQAIVALETKAGGFWYA